jgi:hypothetical protein
MSNRLPLLLAGVLAFVACESTDPDGDTSLSILLTDMPGDVSQAVVMIEDVQLVGGGDGPISLMTAGPWVGDLTELENEFVSLVDGAIVPQGTYGQLRLIIPEACVGIETEGETDDTDEVYVSDGATTVTCEGTEVGRLRMPSLAQTGIKVVFQGALELLSDQMIYLFDFNVEESFGRQAGMSGMWVMNPVIHGAEYEFTGTVELTVELGDGVEFPSGVTFEDFEATFAGGSPVPLTTEGDVGTATFLYAIPGTSSLDLDSDDVTSFTTDPEVPFDVEVGSQEEKAVAVTITGVTE